jgi:hypothetical protein
MEGQLIVAAPAVTPVLSQSDVRLAVDTKPNDATRVLFDFNKQALAQAMRARGLTSVMVTYSGCGDEGRTEGVAFEPADVDEGLEPIVTAQMRYRWDEERACGGSELVFADMNLQDTAEALCDTSIEMLGHGGFENNDGGQGTFTLHAINAEAELEHSDFYTESDTTTHTL